MLDKGSSKLMVAVALGVFALDAAAKSIARAELPAPGDGTARGLHVWGVVGLERVANAGSVLGFAQGGIAWIPLAALGLGAALALPRLRRRTSETFVAAGLLAGGAWGNLFDRIRFGAVTDFLLVGSQHAGLVLNPADLAMAGGVLLALRSRDHRRPSPPYRPPEPAFSTSRGEVSRDEPHQEDCLCRGPVDHRGPGRSTENPSVTDQLPNSRTAERRWSTHEPHQEDCLCRGPVDHRGPGRSPEDPALRSA